MSTGPLKLQGSVHLYVPIYRNHVYFFNTREGLDKACTKLQVEKIDHSGADGLATWMTNQNGAKIFLLGVFNKDQSTLVHEISHTCLDICEHLGIKVTSDDSEPFAYLMGFMYNNLIKHLKPVKRRK